MLEEQRELQRLADIAVILKGHEDIKGAKTDRTGYVLDVAFTDGSKYRLEMVAEKKAPREA